jgi:A/G-specific adenine glycosylase
MPAAWQSVGQVHHGFTHFALTLDLLAACVPRIDAPGFARPIAALAREALPSVMRKCARMAGSALQP